MELFIDLYLGTIVLSLILIIITNRENNHFSKRVGAKNKFYSNTQSFEGLFYLIILILIPGVNFILLFSLLKIFLKEFKI